MIRRTRRGPLASVGLALVALLLAGCGFTGLYQVPLPGGADLGDRPFRVTANFADVLDLVPQAAVKVNDVAVGKVERIELAEDNETAVVNMVVNGEVRLPGNAGAALRQSSLLGEKYVLLTAPPTGQERGRLTEGARIPVERTNRSPEIEEVLGALSLLLNGGGIEQVRTIVREVNAGLDGNVPELRALLSNVHTLVGDLDSQRGNIVRAIESLNRFAGTVRAQTADLTTALDDLAPGLRVVNQQRDQLVGMLTALNRLSETAVDTVHRTREDLVTDLRLLEPTLRKLADAGSDLPKSLQMLVTFPFTDYFVNTVKGDFTNVHVNFDLDLSETLRSITNQRTPLIELPDSLRQDGASTGEPAAPPALPLPGTAEPRPAPATAGEPAPAVPGSLGELVGNLLGGG
ncbi:phospholipid/cholesterol/gamma-HCH transport system substrate-binding protein [Tamaricihabitans halophyticus]|uniref:Phospholipid/cholesterol/gamma-HCH transport system substrate-binding protein n=1 Tax=Tamaricihabitans halophyticus TaxID=1262583 RepID=A0A4R2QEC3_9PSEU|nr:MCE family protein [Tamaricihabitans halophyticus]TCP45391.1 phospholipid/cholesterol/gamma-HCH transport system substrate-binding protein [Tamaricihabitans halophyticus]